MNSMFINQEGGGDVGDKGGVGGPSNPGGNYDHDTGGPGRDRGGNPNAPKEPAGKDGDG